LGIGDWGLGGLGIGPIPNPHIKPILRKTNINNVQKYTNKFIY